MEKILHNIRKQPDNVKKRILHIVVAALGFILVLLWVYSLGVTFTSPATVNGMKQDLQSINSLKDNSPSIPSSW